MEEVNWKVEGMTCANCALTISNYLEKEGLKNIHVNPITGKVSFETEGDPSQKEKIAKYIHGLGYKVIQKPETDLLHRRKMNRHLTRTLFCLPFTLLLMIHMIPGIRIDLLMNPWVQLFLCLPVYIAGLKFLGATAFRSILNGMPNMNVLIIIGATAAFIYSFVGTLFHLGMNYQFFETTAVIITLVFFGYYLEDASVASTQRRYTTWRNRKKC